MKDAVRLFLQNPPAGSKTRAALDFGIDLTLTARNMFALTPAQRLERLQQDQIKELLVLPDWKPCEKLRSVDDEPSGDR